MLNDELENYLDKDFLIILSFIIDNSFVPTFEVFTTNSIPCPPQARFSIQNSTLLLLLFS